MQRQHRPASGRPDPSRARGGHVRLHLCPKRKPFEAVLDRWPNDRRASGNRKTVRVRDCCHRNRINSRSDVPVDRADAAAALPGFCAVRVLRSHHARLAIPASRSNLATTFSKGVFAIGHDVRVWHRVECDVQIRVLVRPVRYCTGTNWGDSVRHQFCEADV